MSQTKAMLSCRRVERVWSPRKITNEEKMARGACIKIQSTAAIFIKDKGEKMRKWRSQQEETEETIFKKLLKQTRYQQTSSYLPRWRCHFWPKKERIETTQIKKNELQGRRTRSRWEKMREEERQEEVREKYRRMKTVLRNKIQWRLELEKHGRNHRCLENWNHERECVPCETWSKCQNSPRDCSKQAFWAPQEIRTRKGVCLLFSLRHFSRVIVFRFPLISWTSHCQSPVFALVQWIRTADQRLSWRRSALCVAAVWILLCLLFVVVVALRLDSLFLWCSSGLFVALFSSFFGTSHCLSSFSFLFFLSFSALKIIVGACFLFVFCSPLSSLPFFS